MLLLRITFTIGIWHLRWESYNNIRLSFWRCCSPSLSFDFSANCFFYVWIRESEHRGDLSVPGPRSDAIISHVNWWLLPSPVLESQATSTSITSFWSAISMCCGVSDKPTSADTVFSVEYRYPVDRQYVYAPSRAESSPCLPLNLPLGLISILWSPPRLE